MVPAVYAQNWVKTYNTQGPPILIDLDSITSLGENFFYLIKYDDFRKGVLFVAMQYQIYTNMVGVIDTYTASEFYENNSSIYKNLGTHESKSLKVFDVNSPIYNSVKMALGVKPEDDLRSESLKSPVTDDTSSSLIPESENEPDFGPYMRKLQEQIRTAWHPPKGDKSKRVVVLFKIGKDGTLLSNMIQQSSGDYKTDRAALEAVQSVTFDPLPAGFKEASVDIHFTFAYNVFGTFGN